MNIAVTDVDLAELGLDQEITEHQVPAVIEQGGTAVAAQPSSDATMNGMIERLARDPAVDVVKLERLVAMKERAEAKLAEQLFNEAMNEAQGDIRPIAADANNKQTSSKYATYLALDKALRPIYTRHGFSLSFDTGDAGADMVRVLCYVAHRDGHSRTYKVDMPADGKGAKGGDVMTRTHAAGAAMTYGQRYLLKLIFNIAVGEDDDGNSADGAALLNTDQLATIYDLIERSGANVELFCQHMKIDAVKSIRAKDFGKAVASLNTKLHKSSQQKDGKK